MELRHLRYFVAIAEHRHFGRAARSLGIQQPPLSNQIRALEQELGTRLLERTSRTVELTTAGEAFLGSARESLRSAARAATTATTAARHGASPLQIGFVGTAMYSLLPPVLRTYRASQPKIALDPIELSSTDQVERLMANQIDVAFVRAPLRAADDRVVQSVPVLREPVIAVLPRSHPLARNRTVPVAELADEPLVLASRQPESGLYARVLELCMNAGFDPVIGAETAQLHNVIGLVAAGAGIALAPRSLAKVHNDEVVFRWLEPTGPALVLTMAWLENNPNPAVGGFIELTRQVAARMETAGARPKT